ncbi:preprotein translocase subunit SecG [Candidatus Dependentiae bacterium]|nr:preprotein translocase subunit SecG [Candidatus Dependentiae bacterium]
MVGFFMFLFVLLTIFLVLFILVQQGKGDMGLGSLGRGGQMLFGGSGGQDFFEKTTWIMGAIFMLGALTLTILRTREAETSRLTGYRAPITQKTVPGQPGQPGKPGKPLEK